MSSAEFYLDGPPGEKAKERAVTPQPPQETPRAARIGGGGMREGGGRRSNRFPLERQYAESGKSTPERRSSETGDELAAILGRRSRTSTASSIGSTAAEMRAAPGCTSCGLPAAAAALAALPPPIPIPMRKERDELSSPLSSSPAGLPPPIPTTPTSRHSANSSPHELTAHSPHSGQLQRANRPSPILLKENKELQPPTVAAAASAAQYGNKLSGECICNPPVLLSPVLSRPIRSASAASSPLPGRNHMGSDSDGDLNVVWRLPQNRRSMDRPGSRTNTPTLSPILNRSTSASKLAASFAANRSSSGSGLLSTRVLLRRTDSDAADARRRRKGKRRPSFMSHGMCSETSMDSCSSSTSNLTKMRLSLGHSDPQISASSMSMHAAAATSAAGPSSSSAAAAAAATTALPAVRMRKDVLSHSQRTSHSRHSTARRSLNTSTSPVLAPRARSPHRQLLPSAAGSSSGSYHGSSAAGIAVAGASQPSTSTSSTNSRGVIAPVPLRSYSTRSGSSLMAPGHHHHHDNRRWSLASLPSTSGYGTPGSNSAFSSQYSSNEQLCEALDGIRLHHSQHHGHHAQVGSSSHRFDSNDSSVTNEEVAAVQRGEREGGMTPHSFRPRSRSLTSPIKLGGSEWTTDVVVRNSVYKERFPRAKQQMEEKLETFVRQNAPLSGGPSSAETDDVTSGGGGGARNRKSMVMTAETTLEPALLRLIADGATRFLHHQLVEIASDCVQRSRDDTITCSYFCEMSQRLDETLNEATQKTSGDSFEYLNKLVRQLLMIVSRPARLLECLEFDPDEFYHLLEEAEGVVREQLGSGTARVPDLPQYIIGKLGLDRDPLLESEQAGAASPPSTPTVELPPEQKQEDGHRAPCEDDLETIRLVSNGAYGAVYLVRHRETRQRFALKKMNKQTLMLRNQIDQVFAERDILTMTDNPFVVSFYGSFETRHHLCMLMEYVEGGDCASLLKNAGTLPIDLMKLYVAETILAIEYLHSYGVVHRDLKPDNLLITAMGHIKLTDFGLSKIGLMNRTTLVAEGVADIAETQQFKDKQLCGTPEYIAPEVIIRQGYGKPVDWWALGIISYEFLVGIVPFFGESPEDLFSKVISEEVEYPDGDESLPPAAESLIKQLLEKNPIERLGSVTGAPELMAHEFFVDLDFNGLLRQKAEFVPQLENEEDTSYFDSRTDRYNHDAESNGEEDASIAPMFHSFSTASPRHSIVGLEPGPLLPPERIAACTSPLSHEFDSPSPTPSIPSRPTPSPSGMNRKPAPPSAQSSEDHSTTDSMNDVHDKYGQPMPSAVLLRRRFSAQRQSNLSTSSSGTTGTGCVGTAPSSTDSSMDAFAFGERRLTHGEEGRLRTDSTSTAASSISRRSPLPRFAISCDPDEDLPCSSGSFSAAFSSSAVPALSQLQQQQSHHELSPVDEGAVRSRSASSSERLPGSLQLVIPSGTSSSSSSKISPGAASACSLSSTDGCSPSHSSLEHSQSTTGGAPVSPLSMAPPIVIRKGPFGFGFTIKSVRVYLGEHSDYYTIEHIVSSVDERGPSFEAGLRCEDMITAVNSQPVHNMTHPQLMNLMLSSGCEIVLKVTPLSATGIREGGPRKSVGKLAKKQKPKCPKRRLPCEKKSRKPSSLLRRLSGKRNANDIVPGSSSQKQTFMPRSVSSQDGVILQPAPTSAPPTGAAPVSGYGAGAAPPGVSSATGANSSSGSMSSMGGVAHSHKRMSDVGLMREEHRSPLVAASSTSAFSPAHPSSSHSQIPSPRPSTLTGLKPSGVPLTVSPSPSPRSISTTAAAASAAGLPFCPTLSMSGATTSAAPLSTSPIPVSPLARHPSVSRPASPRPEVAASAAPAASDRPAPPPIPPPPAARNLIQRLLNKE
ncbi:hypothetical protein PFISCL1PPCAC_5392 [Pristionchus fissidentatus]|uniref:non-specific serine/threonine protein kinase n=1 Tax=Pristionchus fissidentatus TaxID=1538716 RepID=A0AAV5V6D9_9BILA|nr:hypothetical protein PFISCL1PPCAC_5392 [Pristionchus fissidentatus]